MAKSPAARPGLRVCIAQRGWPTSNQLPASMVARNAPASCRLREREMGKMANRLMSKAGEGHVFAPVSPDPAEAVQADEGEEHHHRHQVAQRQLHALALEVDEIGEGDEGERASRQKILTWNSASNWMAGRVSQSTRTQLGAPPSADR